MRKILVKSTILTNVYAKKLLSLMQRNPPKHNDKYWQRYIINIALHALAMQKEMKFNDVEMTNSEKAILWYFNETDTVVYAHRFMIWAQQMQRDLGENLSYSDTDIVKFKKAFNISDNDQLYQKCLDLEFNRFVIINNEKDKFEIDIDIVTPYLL